MVTRKGIFFAGHLGPPMVHIKHTSTKCMLVSPTGGAIDNIVLTIILMCVHRTTCMYIHFWMSLLHTT